MKKKSPNSGVITKRRAEKIAGHNTPSVKSATKSPQKVRESRESSSELKEQRKMKGHT